MCPSTKPMASTPQTTNTGSDSSTCFSCTRLNQSTFQIAEDDKWSQIPFIYIKIYESAIVVIDTGCGGASRDPSASLTSLRQFIETFPVSDNAERPLNPGG